RVVVVAWGSGRRRRNTRAVGGAGITGGTRVVVVAWGSGRLEPTARRAAYGDGAAFAPVVLERVELAVPAFCERLASIGETTPGICGGEAEILMDFLPVANAVLDHERLAVEGRDRGGSEFAGAGKGARRRIHGARCGEGDMTVENDISSRSYG